MQVYFVFGVVENIFDNACKYSTMSKISSAMSETNYISIYICIYCIGKLVPSESVRHLLKWNFILSGDGGSYLCVFARKVYGNGQSV